MHIQCPPALTAFPEVRLRLLSCQILCDGGTDGSFIRNLCTQQVVGNNTSLSVGGSGKIVQPRFARNGMAEFNGITDGIDRLVGSLQ